MFLITDMFFFHGNIELQRVRSDKISLLWFSFRSRYMFLLSSATLKSWKKKKKRKKGYGLSRKKYTSDLRLPV